VSGRNSCRHADNGDGIGNELQKLVPGQNGKHTDDRQRGAQGGKRAVVPKPGGGSADDHDDAGKQRRIDGACDQGLTRALLQGGCGGSRHGPLGERVVKVNEPEHAIHIAQFAGGRLMEVKYDPARHPRDAGAESTRHIAAAP